METIFHQSVGVRRSGLLVALCLTLGLMPAPAVAQYGHTQGGYGGAALGAAGGASLGTALVAAAGLANPLLSGAVVATGALGGLLVGGKVGSQVGNSIDRKFSVPDTWAMVGAVSGSLLGFTLGPSGSLVGKVLGAGIGALAGAWAGDHFAGKANKDYNPRTIGALIGGINGALAAGPIGAAVGVPLGYIGGNLMEKYVFSDRSFKLPEWRGWDGNGRSGRGNYAHGYYPPDPNWKHGPGGFDAGGRDREGFDRNGYDHSGYDREGYDLAGFDRYGRDRQGHDKNGFRSATSGTPGTKPLPTYDPEIYDGYWGAWKTVGGDYPALGQDHFKFFPESERLSTTTRYQVAAEASGTQPVSVSGGSSDSDLVAVKQDYMKAIERVQALTKAGASTTEQQAALADVKRLEDQLKGLMNGAK